MYTLPPAASSAGVPITMTVPALSSSRDFRAIPAAHEAVPIMLCPQPCPTPGRASYSASRAMRGPPDPAVARNAVDISQIPLSTTKPLASKNSLNTAADLCSSKATSGLAWIFSESSMSSLRRRSTSAVTRCFNESRSPLVAPCSSVLGPGCPLLYSTPPMDLKQFIRDIPDFPQQGILFRDITPLLQTPDAFKYVVDRFTDEYRQAGLNAVVAIESRGFLF